METFAIIVDNISKKFILNKQRNLFNIIKGKTKFQGPQSILALQGVSFKVKKGEILGIIGLNGSGKSTLLRIIAGVYAPDSGSVKVNGRLSAIMQLGAGFQPELNARENIIMNGMLLGLSKKTIEEKAENIIQYAELEQFEYVKLKYFSAGMRARLGFSTATQIDPDILLIDEILAVGDKNFREKSFKSFLSFKNRKKTIIYATHNLAKLSEFSDRVLLIHKGKVVSIGNPDEILQNYKEIKSNK